MTTRIKTDEEIQAMREGGKMLAKVLAELKSKVSVGMSTKDLSDIAQSMLTSMNTKPAFLGYQGFKDVLCVSLNDEVVHGIPTKNRIIRDGDIVSCDFGVLHNGLITDAAMSCIVGSPKSPHDVQLLQATEKSLKAAVAVIKDGVAIGTVGHAVQEVLERSGLGIVRDFVGHGVGHELHEEPGIPNVGRKGDGFVLRAGMTIAIEPMATLGGHGVYIADDGWTTLTTDGSRSAHFEHTILVTPTGAEILTSL